MISYEVTLDIDPRFAEGVETYMRQKHIPEIFSTGCFQQIHFERASSTRFRSRYQALTQAHFDRYLGDHAQHFRNDFRTHFPHGVVPFREVWNELQSVEPRRTATQAFNLTLASHDLEYLGQATVRPCVYTSAGVSGSVPSGGINAKCGLTSL